MTVSKIPGLYLLGFREYELLHPCLDRFPIFWSPVHGKAGSYVMEQKPGLLDRLKIALTESREPWRQVGQVRRDGSRQEGPSPRILSPQERVRIQDLRERGYKITEVAFLFGISRHTVQRASRGF